MSDYWVGFFAGFTVAFILVTVLIRTVSKENNDAR